jgi:hypothetical protein
MAVRKKPRNHLFATGGYSNRKSEEVDVFKSLLEIDNRLLLDFGAAVEPFITNFSHQLLIADIH